MYEKRMIMQHTRTLILTIIFLGIFFHGCKKSGDTIVDSPPIDNNLIKNSSFESNGNPSLEGWITYWPGISLVQSVQDAPPGGGSWSVAIQNGTQMSGNEVRYKVAAPATGKHAYRLSFWGKYTSGSRLNWSSQFGEIWLDRGDVQISDSKWGVKMDTTVWKLYSVIDTLDTRSSDSLIVRLVGCIDGLPSAITYFDLCRLEVAD